MILDLLEYGLLSTTKKVEKGEIYFSFYDGRYEEVVTKGGASAADDRKIMGKRIGHGRCLLDEVYFKLFLDGDMALVNINQSQLVVENNTGEGRAKNWRVEVAKT